MTLPATDHVMVPEIDHVTSEKINACILNWTHNPPCGWFCTQNRCIWNCWWLVWGWQTGSLRNFGDVKDCYLKNAFQFSFKRCEHCLGDSRAPTRRDCNIGLSTELNLKLRKDVRASNFRTPYLLFDSDEIFRERGRSKNRRPPGRLLAALLPKNCLHFDGFDNRPASLLISITTDSYFFLLSLIIFIIILFKSWFLNI